MSELSVGPDIRGHHAHKGSGSMVLAHANGELELRIVPKNHLDNERPKLRLKHTC